jgi:lysine-N-methylase
MQASNKTIRVAQQPQYLSNFTCLGGECPDTCCSGWTIDVDKAHYKALKKAAATEPAVKHLAANLKRYDDAKPKRYGTIMLQKDGAAPCLSAERDCTIQKALGHEMLPEICQIYPRYYIAIGSRTEVHGTLSCPEMARLCLMDPQALEMGENELPIPLGKPIPYNRGFHTRLEKAAHPLRRNFYAIRDLLIFCIDAQSLPFYDRLLLATATVGKLAEFKVDTAETMLETDRKIEFLLLQTRLAILQGHVEISSGQELAGSKAVTAQLSLLQRMTDERLKMGSGGKAFLEKLRLAFVGLQFDANNMEHVANRYVAARDHYFSKIMSENPQLFENLVKNLIFSDCLPTGKGGDIANEWSDLLIAVGLIRAYLIGLSAHFQHQFSMVHCVGMIQSFYRVIQHNQKFYANLREKLDELGLNSLATYMLLSK